MADVNQLNSSAALLCSFEVVSNSLVHAKDAKINAPSTKKTSLLIGFLCVKCIFYSFETNNAGLGI